MLRFNMEQDEKITIRISRDILEEIDEFLERNPTLGNRSEFLRNLAVEYIAKSRSKIQLQSQEAVCVQLPGLIQNILDESVQYGFFTSISEALSVVLNDLAADGQLLKVVAKRFDNLKATRMTMQEFRKSLESMNEEFKVERTDKK